MQSTAATKPGPDEPRCLAASDPRAGPIITPALVAALIQPSASARFSGGTESLT